MKILFGIQGTGNGHLSRSREIVRALMAVADVEVLISGGMHEVSDLDVPVHLVRGIELAFGTAGRVGYLESWERLDLAQFRADVRQVPAQAFDLIISDFEPVTAWAARIRHHPCLAVSHHAFLMLMKVRLLVHLKIMEVGILELVFFQQRATPALRPMTKHLLVERARPPLDHAAFIN